MSSTVIFAGCSFTAGNGWQDLSPAQSSKIECKDHENLWVNICHRSVPQLQTLQLVNVAQGGASNTDVFKTTVAAIAQHADSAKYVVCQWTSMPRYNFEVGFETWSTKASMRKYVLPPTHNIDLNNGQSYSRAYIDDLLNRLLVLHHLHWEICKVVEYSAIISKLCSALGIEPVFVNGLCPWDQDYFVRKTHNFKPQELSSFVKQTIINIESRDDQEIFELYNRAHNDYQQAGGINHTHWLNLYDPWNSKAIDRNFDQQHPGIKSNQLFAEQVKTFFSNKFSS